jgi:hypothetical protein
MSDSTAPPPPEASFTLLISMLGTQALAAMGQLPLPGQEKPEKRMDYAKHYIDMLDVLESKTQGNLSQEEQQMLQRSTHQLRMLFVEASK